MNARRDWIKKAIALGVSVPAGMSLSEQLMAAPVSETEFLSMKGRPADAKIRLGSNENPYGPSDKAKQAVIKFLSEGNRYPFQTVTDFKKTLADHEGVTPDHILIGAGSGDLLCATGAAFGVAGGNIVAPYPTFPMLMNYAEVFNTKWEKVNLNDKLEIDYNELAKRISSETKMVFVCNPNNPTGTLVDPKLVKSFCEEVSTRVPVYADEAYLEFLEPEQQVSMVDLVRQNKDVIVSRTFSKIYGIAGMRVGYIVARPDLIKKISKYQPGIPNNQLGLAAAKASLGDTAFMAMSRKKNAEARKHTTDFLKQKGLFFGDSYTNFVFFDPKADALAILNKLNAEGILIRSWDYLGKQWLRVSIGTMEEMKIFTKAYDKITA